MSSVVRGAMNCFAADNHLKRSCLRRLLAREMARADGATAMPANDSTSSANLFHFAHALSKLLLS